MLSDTYYLGITLVILGLVLVLLGFTMFRGRRTSSDYGGVIIIGPIPIVFAKNKNTALILLIIAAVIILMLYIVPLLMNK